ncbi:MAG: Hpt domain-containing protein [Perlucidibaca sp.]
MMSDDLEDDAEWQALLAGFRRHFWEVRVPLFWQSWEAARTSPMQDWSEELKRSVHGLAGVAALVGHPEVGDQARVIEQCWNRLAQGDEAHVRELIGGLAATLHGLEQAAG